ncbi:MAG: exodeoxyribonuclease VII large subunit [Rhodobacteraceae bacterium TMED111]|nr:exodeoxyribonuclease VII large subunit [Marinovum sp.]OUV40973.1 MAG: exodeoxyribonuclease VII large subunit [Rhodobacteraceae bacterium TMED111]
MSDLFESQMPGINEPEFSVSEISNAIKRLIEEEFSYVRIRGEIGRVSLPRSGHVYLDLKDEKSVIAGVIWKGVADKLMTKPEEGMEVIARGRVTTFGGQSKYQIIIDDLRPAGVGALMAMLEKRKKQFQAEGIFNQEHKKPLPFLPEIIGVITSPSGAVIKDILHRLSDRFPRKVTLWPVAVQGDNCAREVSRAIDGFNSLTVQNPRIAPDLIIVARGGGSIEDLWGFNEELVVRSAFKSTIPLISAIGHETDTTLLDYVADVRAPTPSAAAEMAVPVRHELLALIDANEARLSRALSQVLLNRSQRLLDISRSLPRVFGLLEGPTQRLDSISTRLPISLTSGVKLKKSRLFELSTGIKPTSLIMRLENSQSKFELQAKQLKTLLGYCIDLRKQTLGSLFSRIENLSLKREILHEQKNLKDFSLRVRKAYETSLTNLETKLQAIDRLRETLGYRETLNRGYAVIRSGDNVITEKAKALYETNLSIEFRDGELPIKNIKD